MEQDKTVNRGERIARNTLMLYVRMLVLMLVGLYTSRVVLAALGETDYGIYNVIGGVVAMFTIISGALNSSVSRFITFEMGKGESAQLQKVYSTAVYRKQDDNRSFEDSCGKMGPSFLGTRICDKSYECAADGVHNCP